MRSKRRDHSDDDNNEFFELDPEAVEMIENEYDDYFPPEQPKKQHRKLKRFIVWILIFCIAAAAVNVGALLYKGKIWFNQPEKKDYPIRGAMVDEELGKINWKEFSAQNLSLAYIKATEGTAYKDEKFDDNWKESADSDLLVGAYHVMRLSKNGKKQAESFFEAVGDSVKGRLVPAVEVTLSGLYNIFPPDKDDVVKNLKEFCKAVKDKYGVSPIIICNKRSYEKYLADDFSDYKLCVKDYLSEPDEDIKWGFWCYNPRVRVRGYKNNKEYFTMFVYKEKIDMDDFKKKFVV